MKKGIFVVSLAVLGCGCLGIGFALGRHYQKEKEWESRKDIKEINIPVPDVTPSVASPETVVSIISPEHTDDPYEKNKILASDLWDTYKISLQQETTEQAKDREDAQIYRKNYIEDANSYLLEGSATSMLTTDDYIYLDAETTKIARNEIYARHGYLFDDEKYQDIFDKKNWYRSISNYTKDVQLSEVEIFNVACLKWWENVDHTAWQQKLDKGFTDCYRFNVNQTFTMDLNGDGIQEEISYKQISNVDDIVSTCSIEVNGKVQDTLEGNFAPYIWVVDVDPNDMYKELVIYDAGPSDDPVDSYYYYDGEKLINMGAVEGHLNEDDYIQEKTLHAVKRFDILGTARYRWDYQLTDEHMWEEIPSKYMEACIPVIAQEDINIYNEASLESGKKRHHAGTTFTAIGTDLQEWVKVKLEDESIGWINIEEYPTYKLGGLRFYD